MIHDQAAGLRKLSNHNKVRVIAVTGGKGGVGKTNISVNMAMALQQRGQRVMLFDADLGLANIDVLLGLNPKFNLGNVIRGECEFSEAIVSGPMGVKIMPASSGHKAMANLSEQAHGGIIQGFSAIGKEIDTLIIDTAAGISDSVISFTRAAQTVLVVVCDEPTSITDAYAMMKILNKDHNINHFQIVSSMVQNAAEGKKLYEKLSLVSDRFLDVVLEYMGHVPFDLSVKKSVKKQRAVIDAFPDSPASREIIKVAQAVSCLPVTKTATGNLEFFIERLVNQSPELME